MAEEPNDRLRQFLNDGGNWERKATNIPGAFLFRLPIDMNIGKADSNIAEAGIQYQNQSDLSVPVLEAAID